MYDWLCRLLNRDGVLLAYSGYGEMNVCVTAAIASSVWSSYEKLGYDSFHDDKLDCIFIECEVTCLIAIFLSHPLKLHVHFTFVKQAWFAQQIKLRFFRKIRQYCHFCFLETLKMTDIREKVWKRNFSGLYCIFKRSSKKDQKFFRPTMEVINQIVFQAGSVAITSIAGLLLCMCAKTTVPLGMLRAKVRDLLNKNPFNCSSTYCRSCCINIEIVMFSSSNNTHQINKKFQHLIRNVDICSVSIKQIINSLLVSHRYHMSHVAIWHSVHQSLLSH